MWSIRSATRRRGFTSGAARRSSAKTAIHKVACPVTASTTPRGRLFYGAGIGLLVYIIRGFGGYPDGVAFAVLLMNIAAPTIDLYTPPRVFGARRE